jgi:hypothetical protein
LPAMNNLEEVKARGGPGITAAVFGTPVGRARPPLPRLPNVQSMSTASDRRRALPMPATLLRKQKSRIQTDNHPSPAAAGNNANSFHCTPPDTPANESSVAHWVSQASDRNLSLAFHPSGCR